jgi:hypothetical protein
MSATSVVPLNDGLLPNKTRRKRNRRNRRKNLQPQSANITPTKSRGPRKFAKPAKQFRKPQVGTVAHSLRGNAAPSADPRIAAQKSIVKTSRLVTQNDKIKIVQPVELKAFLGVLNGIVAYAVQRGFQDFVDPQFAYAAQQFLSTTILNVANGVTPTAVSLPRWIANWLKSISPKVIPFYAGEIDYSWRVITASSDNDSDPVLFNSPVTSNYRFYGMWVLDTTTNLDGFFNVIAPNPYTPTEGEKAMISLFKFLEDDDKPQEAFKYVMQSEVAKSYAVDVSPFAFPDTIMGSGFSKSGGYCQTAGSEVPIKRPAFSVFALKQSGEGDSDRIAKKTVLTGGSSFWVGNLILNCSDNELQSKRNPIFKNVDILEFIDVTARWLTKALSLFKNDTMNTGSSLPNTLPMQFELFQLIIRAVLMNNFENSQCWVQDLYPKIPATPASDVFLPLGCGIGTCPKKGYGDNVLLPLPLIENMKILRMNKVRMSQFKNDWVHIVPVLGKFKNTGLLGDSYTYTVGETTYSVFSPVVVAPPTKGAKPAPNVETYDLIDGTDSAGPVAINAGALQSLIEIWNDFVVQLAPYSARLSTLGIDSGPMEVRNLEQTLVLAVPGSEARLQPVTEAQKKIRAKYQKSYGAKIGEGPFDNIQAHACSSQMPFNGPAWAVQSILIFPVTWLDFVGTNEGIMTLPKHQSYSNEVFSLSMTGVLGEVLAVRHDIYASQMTHTRDGGESDFSKFFQLKTDHGEGGILSGMLANMIAGDNPTAKAVLGGLSGLLPI